MAHSRTGGRIREPAVAGFFYPAEPGTLHAEVVSYLSTVATTESGRKPKAVIVPHAGTIYSGPVAAHAYASLRPYRREIERVVMLGPSHRAYLHGCAISTAEAFSTPLGSVPVDRVAVADLLARRLPGVRALDEPHVEEHCLEVQMPFLIEVLGNFSIVPIVFGEATTQEVAELIDAAWDGNETLILVSSDLSHYHDYATARRLDSETTHAIESLNPDGVGHDQACGQVPIRGLLKAARDHGLTAHTLDLRNSGDTAGPRDRVVGYGAYIFTGDG